MSWLDRAAREIVEKAEPPTAKTDETPVLAVLAVPQTHISQKSGADESIAPRFSDQDADTFERTRAAMRSRLAREVAERHHVGVASMISMPRSRLKRAPPMPATASAALKRIRVTDPVIMVWTSRSCGL